MKNYIGAIDQGTTSTRFMVFDSAGRVAGMAQKEHAQYSPSPGWVEHDAEEILAMCARRIRRRIERRGHWAVELAAIGITNQRETTVLWDRRTGKPLHRALVWQDTRVDRLVAEYSADGGKARFQAKTGLPLASYFSALKLRWLLDNVPDARAMAEAGDALFGTIDCWLAWNFCGLHVTDVTNASRTQLMDLLSLDWCEELLAAFRIPRACLPRIVASSEVIGTISADVATELAGVTLGGMLGDQQAALVGQMCFAQGEAKNTYGTGCFLLMNTGACRWRAQPGCLRQLLTNLARRRALMRSKDRRDHRRIGAVAARQSWI